MTFIEFISCILAVIIPALVLFPIYWAFIKYEIVERFGLVEGIVSILFIYAIIILPIITKQPIEQVLLSFQ